MGLMEALSDFVTGRWLQDDKESTPRPSAINPRSWQPKPSEKSVPLNQIRTTSSSSGGGTGGPQWKGGLPGVSGSRPGGGSTVLVGKEQGPGPSRVNRELMERLGWTLPANEAPAAVLVSEEMLNRGGATDIGEHDYQVPLSEYQLLFNEYGGGEQYTPGRYLTEQSQVPTIASGKMEAVPLTEEAYNKLTPDQRRAVDFNTLMIEARKKDFALMGETGDDAYNKRVAGIFGEEGGSERYAPNTIDLLERSGFRALGQDLDEYLSGERLIGMDELMNYTPATGGGTVMSNLDLEAITDSGEKNQYGDIRSIENQLKVDTMAINRAGQLIDDALRHEGAWNKDVAITTALTGAGPTGMDIPWGFGTPEDRLNPTTGAYDDPMHEFKDSWFQDQYRFLTDPNADVSTVWANINDSGLGDEDVQQLFNYFDLRTKRDIDLGVVDPSLRPATEVRAQLGFEG